jgi:hypothetical protein
MNAAPGDAVAFARAQEIPRPGGPVGVRAGRTA